MSGTRRQETKQDEMRRNKKERNGTEWNGTNKDVGEVGQGLSIWTELEEKKKRQMKKRTAVAAVRPCILHSK